MDLMDVRREMMGVIASRKSEPTGIYGKDYVWTDNYYLGTNSNSTGVQISSSYYKYTAQFIPCEFLAGKNVLMTGGPSTATYAGCCYYSEANESSYITGSAHNQSIKLVPNNAKYLRMCTNKSKDVSLVSIEPYNGD